MIKILISPILFIILMSCFTEKEEDIKNKLDILLQDDLATIVAELEDKSPKSLLDKPYYRIDKYEYFEKATTFNHKAVVIYYYLKDIQMIQERKYRYFVQEKKWYRYKKEIRYNLQGKQ